MPVLHAWRRAWSSDSKIAALGREADRTLAERNKVAVAEPTDDVFAGMPPALERFGELRRSNVVASNEFLDECQATLSQLDPLIVACTWLRWLRLEEALEAELRAGSLTGTALVLRTMTDELGVIMMVTNPDRKHSDATLADLPTIHKHMRFLDRHVLPHMRLPSDSEMQVQLSEDIRLPPHLKSARQSLNDYVHPNHGSNEVALRPEESVAGRILLTVIVALYKAAIPIMPRHFGSLVVTKRTPPRLGPIDEWKRLVNETGPSIAQFGRDRYGDGYVLDLNSLKYGAREDLDDVHVPRYSRELRSLIHLTGSAAKTVRAPLATFPNRVHDLGFPAQEAWTVTLPAARLLARKLDALVEGPPPPQEWDEGMRFRYLAESIELTVLATQYKTRAIALSLARMLNQSNPLGSVLMARSLIEHHAVATHLASVVAAWLDDAELGQAFEIDSLERGVVMFLCGTNRTAERTGAMRQRWLELSSGTIVAVQLMKAVNECFAQKDAGRVLYNVFSNYIHGLQMPSGDLVRPGSLTNENLVLYKALYVLARFSPFVPGGGATASTVLAMFRLGRMADALDNGSAMDDAARTTRTPHTLVESTDYIGDGSEDRPFRFRAGLHYIEAFNSFCRERRIEGTRVLWRYGTSGWGDRLDLKDGGVLFFADTPY